ncbi:hypothetical protein NL676_030029 [Syzygium grande]|nr:hypothetical protein NL676_030029 [Syzygium grande]
MASSDKCFFGFGVLQRDFFLERGTPSADAGKIVLTVVREEPQALGPSSKRNLKCEDRCPRVSNLKRIVVREF